MLFSITESVNDKSDSRHPYNGECWSHVICTLITPLLFNSKEISRIVDVKNIGENSKKCFHSKHHSKRKCHIIFKEERNYLKIIFLIAVILITTANGHVCRTFSSVIIIFSKPFVFLKSWRVCRSEDFPPFH